MGKPSKKNKQKSATRVELSDEGKEKLYIQIRNAIRNKEFEQAKKLFDQYDPQDDISLLKVRKCVFSLPQTTKLVSPEDYLQTFSALNIDLTNPNHLKILTEAIPETEEELVDTRAMAAQATTILEKASATTAVQQAELACMLSKLGVCVVLYQLIDDKNFSALKQLFKLTKSDGVQNLLQMEALKSIPADFTPKLTDNLIKSVSIDLASFMAVPPIELSGRIEASFMAVPPIELSGRIEASCYISQFLYNAWRHDSKNAKKLLNWFAHKSLDLNAKTIDNNVLLRTMFDQNSSPDFLAFIEFLVSSGKIDLNAKSSDLKGNYVTPVSAAIGLSNLGLYKIILEHFTHGPRITRDSNAQNIKIIMPTLGIEKLTMADRKIFLREIDAITTEFLSAKLEKSLKEAEEKARAAEDALIQNESEAATLPKDKDSEFSDRLLTPREEERAAEAKDKTEDPTSQVNTTERVEADSTEEIINELATLKEGLSKSKWLAAEECEQYELEALFLRYIQTKDKSIKKQITKLIAENLNQEAYQEYKKILSDMASAEDSAETTFSTSSSTENYYELVHALHRAQKYFAFRTETTTEEPMELSTLPGVYQVQGSSNIFMELPQDFIDSLPQALSRKLSAHLTDLKLITSTSRGANGFKIYKGSKGTKQQTGKIKFVDMDDGITFSHHIEGYCNGTKVSLFMNADITSHSRLEHVKKQATNEDGGDITHLIYAAPDGVEDVAQTMDGGAAEDFSLHTTHGEGENISLTGLPTDDSEE